MGNWKKVTIDDVCHKITDGTHSTPKYTNSGIPFLSVKDISGKSISFENTRFISLEEHNVLIKRCNPELNDILYTKVGTTGIAKVVDIERDFSIFVSLALLKPNNKIIDSNFFEHVLNSPGVYKQAQERTRGVANRNLVLKDIKEMSFNLPVKVEDQVEIVRFLDKILDEINNSILLLEENLKHSKALMGSILDEVFTNLENTSEVVKISKIADIKGGKRLPKGEQLQNTKTDYPYIRVTDFNDNGSIDVNDLKYMTKEIQSKISRYIITSDDLYISIAGTIGKTGIIPKELDGANLTENAARFVYKDKKSISNKFVYYYTKSDKFKAFVSEATKQVAQPKLALARLNEIELALPSITEQEKAVAKFIEMEKALSKMEKEIQIKIDNMKALKSSLLDKAFKGEL